MKELRTLVVDDHPLARKRLVTLLEREPDVTIVGQCGDGAEAVEAISRLQPDLAFLDVQMPEMSGFDVLTAIDPDHTPTVIFVTAYDEHAIRAFEIHAIDYLLKPFTNERFRAALSHARRQVQRLRSEAISDRLLTLMREVEPLAPRPARPSRLMLRTDGRVLFISPDQIRWVESEGNYVRLYMEDGSHVLRETMKDLEWTLGDRFVRIHRSHAVQVSEVTELRACGAGDQEVVLRDGTRLKVGQTFQDRLEQRLRRG